MVLRRRSVERSWSDDVVHRHCCCCCCCTTSCCNNTTMLGRLEGMMYIWFRSNPTTRTTVSSSSSSSCYIVVVVVVVVRTATGVWMCCWTIGRQQISWLRLWSNRSICDVTLYLINIYIYILTYYTQSWNWKSLIKVITTYIQLKIRKSTFGILCIYVGYRVKCPF
jgi:hypothetical protein